MVSALSFFPERRPQMEHVRLLRTGSVMDDLKAHARDEKVRGIVYRVPRLRN